MATSRIILVTGGNDGIGFEIVKNLAKKEHTVLIGARSVERGMAAVYVIKGDGLMDGSNVQRPIRQLMLFIRDVWLKRNVNQMPSLL